MIKYFYSFPKDPERRKVWEAQLRRKDFSVKDSTKICSKHFTEDCFDREKFGGTWLKKDAIPTIFDFPPHLQTKQKKRKAPQREMEAVALKS